VDGRSRYRQRTLKSSHKKRNPVLRGRWNQWIGRKRAGSKHMSGSQPSRGERIHRILLLLSMAVELLRLASKPKPRRQAVVGKSRIQRASCGLQHMT